MREKSYIGYIEHGFLTLPEGVVPVSGFSLALEHNRLPRLELSIDPAHDGDGSGTGGVKVARFSELLARYRSAGRPVARRENNRASFSFYMQAFAFDVDGEAQPQRLDVENWVITDVGIGNFSFSGAMDLNVTLSHPAVLLDDDNMRIVAQDSDRVFEERRPANLLEAYADIVEWLTEGTLSAEASEASKVMLERSSALAGHLREYLRWDGPQEGWPRTESKIGDYLHYGLKSIIQGYHHQTPWSFMARDLPNVWGVHIIPTYTMPALGIAPYNPWGSPEVFIEGSDVIDISIPSEGNRISGVVALVNAPGEMMGTSAGAWATGSAQLTAMEAGFVDESLSGSVHTVEAPLYYMMANQLASQASTGTTAGPPEQQRTSYGNPVEDPGVEEVGAPGYTEFREFVERYTRQTFCTLFFQDRAIQLQLRLALDLSNEEPGLVPGRVCQLRDDGAILNFLVTGVTHVVDCNRGTAATVVAGAYVRNQDQIDGIEPLTAGINHVYDGGN